LYSLADLSDNHLSDRLSEYQHYYNWDRVHGSIGKTPMDKVVELSRQTPFWDEVENNYDTSNETIRANDYKKEIRLRKLKRSM